MSKMGKEKIKIVFSEMETLQFHQAYDGGSKFLHYLAEELVKRGFEVEIVTTQLKKNSLQKANHHGVNYTFLPPYYTGRKRFLNLPYKFLFSYNLKNYLKKIKFDILHSGEMFAYFYLKSKKRNLVVFQAWALEPWCGKEPLAQTGLKKIYVDYLLKGSWKYCLDHSDSIAADGEFQIPDLKRIGTNMNKVWFIPNGVTFKKIQEAKKKFKDRRKELNIKKKDLVILSVCQIAPDKGIEDIINGFFLVKKRIKNAKLIMIGRGILEERMRRLIKNKGLEKGVIHLRNIPEEILYDYYFSSDIFVSAATSEDFMICIEEGMAAGLPIISSAQPFLVKNGVNGYVVGFDNPKGIAEGIIKISQAGKKEMKKMGEESMKMAKQYDYGNIASTVIKEYKRLMKLKNKKDAKSNMKKSINLFRERYHILKK